MPGTSRSTSRGRVTLGGLGGGITRDILLGDVPSALTNPA